MKHDPLFESPENQALLVVCARKTIRSAAIGGIVWGVINIAIGAALIQVTMLNAGILALGLIMLGTGITALRKPSLHALLAEAFVSLLILAWNFGITTLNVRMGHAEHVDGHGLIFPIIAAVVFFRQYFKLGYLKEAIGAMDPGTVKEASGLCKQLFKTKLKQSPDVAEASSKRIRVKFMKDSVFCVQRNLRCAFHMSAENFRQCIHDNTRKRIKVVVRHPLGKVTCAFNKKNSDRIKSWLATAAPQTN